MNNCVPSYIKEKDQIILFDGECKLCNGWSRFIIRFDTQKIFKLCAVQSEKGQDILKSFAYPTDYFETMLLVRYGEVLEKSDSFLAVVAQLPFPWSLMRICKLLPKVLRDWFYDRIALNRYTIFGKFDHCILPDADHSQRFL